MQALNPSIKVSILVIIVDTIGVPEHKAFCLEVGVDDPGVVVGVMLDEIEKIEIVGAYNFNIAVENNLEIIYRASIKSGLDDIEQAMPGLLIFVVN